MRYGLKLWSNGFFLLPLALLFVLVAFFAYSQAMRRSYDTYHALWHLAFAAITTCCLLGYAAA